MKMSNLTQKWKAIWTEAKLLKDLQHTEIRTKIRNFWVIWLMTSGKTALKEDGL